VVHLEVVKNTCLLFALDFICRAVRGRFDDEGDSQAPWRQVLWGVHYGVLSAVGMNFPIPVASGVFIDARMSFVALAGVVASWRGATSALLISAIYRLTVGGAGATTGIVSIMAAAVLGYGVCRAALLERWGRLATLIALGMALSAGAIALLASIPMADVASTIRAGWPGVTAIITGSTIVFGLLAGFDLDRRRNWAELKNQAWLLEKTQEISRTGSWYHDLDVDRLECSAELYRILGLPPGTGSARPEELIETVIHPDDVHRTREALAAVRKRGPLQRSKQYRIVRPDGEIRIIRVETAWVESGRPGRLKRRVLGFVQDVTEQDILHEKLEASFRLTTVGELTTAITHEIKNMILIVNTHTARLRTHLETALANPAAVALLAPVEDAMRRISKLVAGIGSVVRVGDANLRLLSVHDILRDSATVFGSLFTADLEFRLELAAHDSRIRGDEGKIHQVLLNLLTNAVHAIAARPSPRITIKTRNEGARLLVSVEDNGCGIEPANLGRIFRPFFTTRAPGEGTGIGLSISRNLLREIGADIDVKSTLGVKTVFTMAFPLANAAARIPAAVSQS
jgi:signal transduction histidine kinase